ncbi:unnamed protein product, partial [Thlaspi arvense]
MRCVEKLTKNNHNMETLHSMASMASLKNISHHLLLTVLEVCPKCDEVMMIPPCSRGSCNQRQTSERKCKGCRFCFPRCVCALGQILGFKKQRSVAMFYDLSVGLCFPSASSAINLISQVATAGDMRLQTLMLRLSLCLNAKLVTVGQRTVSGGSIGAVVTVKRKTPQSSRSWISIDATRQKTVLDVDKYTIMHHVQVHARDLRTLDPNLLYSSPILDRERAIVLSLANPKVKAFNMKAGAQKLTSGGEISKAA